MDLNWRLNFTQPANQLQKPTFQTNKTFQNISNKQNCHNRYNTLYSLGFSIPILHYCGWAMAFNKRTTPVLSTVFPSPCFKRKKMVLWKTKLLLRKFEATSFLFPCKLYIVKAPCPSPTSLT